MATAAPLRHTPLYHWHRAHGARFADRDGWQVAESYAGVEPELATARTGGGLCDVSAFAKVRVIGPGVVGMVRDLLGDGPAGKPLGVAQFTAGDSVLACRLTMDHLLLLAATTSPAGLEQRLASISTQEGVVRTDATCALASFCLVGPATDEVLCRVTPLDVRPGALPVGSCAETSLAGVQALLVRPPGLTVAAVHVYLAWDLGEYVWERLLEAGRELGLAPLGLAGLQRLVSA
jgi:heterotetrameric sarcosine oxidase gamma subunit